MGIANEDPTASYAAGGTRGIEVQIQGFQILCMETFQYENPLINAAMVWLSLATMLTIGKFWCHVMTVIRNSLQLRCRAEYSAVIHTGTMCDGGRE